MTEKEMRQLYNRMDALLIRLRRAGIIVRVEDEAYVVPSPTAQMSSPRKFDSLSELELYMGGVEDGRRVATNAGQLDGSVDT